ncbi:putative membrane protein [Methanoregula boonei 6A8]|uniref:Putative membrane protein n=1 Tax=Methanoregula boonei (strain DSM 21154 / JCM 14090 / 6A8) TaxID=456442 RepID=A7I4Q3_METB6|nr:VTT domain-containing protein [Methanoregula boonei]ABS54714.1 putative membrane protein [Methanoregula boonei 6A8]
MLLPFNIIDVVLHFDKYLPVILQQYGLWTYVVLFLILFLETGIVIAPFLPGDSMLFVAGALAGTGLLDIRILLATLVIACVLGDTVNYWIGYTFEMKVLEWRYSLVKKEHLEETHRYFEKYGGFTIVIARFMPFIRTFAPFLAGVGKMRYSWFVGYNILGGVLWASLFLLTGYFVGNLPIVQANFGLITYAIIAISLVALVSVFAKIYLTMKKEKGSGKA